MRALLDSMALLRCQPMHPSPVFHLPEVICLLMGDKRPPPGVDLQLAVTRLVYGRVWCEDDCSSRSVWERMREPPHIRLGYLFNVSPDLEGLSCAT